VDEQVLVIFESIAVNDLEDWIRGQFPEMEVSKLLPFLEKGYVFELREIFSLFEVMIGYLPGGDKFSLLMYKANDEMYKLTTAVRKDNCCSVNEMLKAVESVGALFIELKDYFSNVVLDQEIRKKIWEIEVVLGPQLKVLRILDGWE
jgi:hypothetical protein